MLKAVLCVLLLIAKSTTSAGETTISKQLFAQSRAEAAIVAEGLMGEISEWLASNFELPRVTNRPSIEFVSTASLEDSRHEHQNLSEAHTSNNDASGDASASRRAVALYDSSKRTIFLANSWTGITPADQSVLVHEMVHHIQNVAQLKFECPMAREKLAYTAQNRWLGRFGTNLEAEFQVDPFTVLVTSLCM